MAAPSTMLPRGHGSTPKFTPDVPRELQRYFKELELLFGPAQIVDDAEKKKHACRYIDIDTADLWEAIPEFDGTKLSTSSNPPSLNSTLAQNSSRSGP
jgi:hypothetical protein